MFYALVNYPLYTIVHNISIITPKADVQISLVVEKNKFREQAERGNGMRIFCLPPKNQHPSNDQSFHLRRVNLFALQRFDQCLEILDPSQPLPRSD